MDEISFDTASNLQGILTLYDESFPGETKFSHEYLDWLYVQNPAGVTISANLVKEKQVLASYAVMPAPFRFGGREYKAALSLNTATHPSERGKGWFTKLAQLVYDRASEEGVDFIIGVANANSIKGFLKYLEFELLGNVKLRLAPVGSHVKVLADHGAMFEAGDAWLRWRLKNPSINYSTVRTKKGDLLIANRRLPFAVGAVKRAGEDLPGNLPVKLGRMVPGYLFSPASFGIAVPKRVIPSPWHMIVRNLRLSDPEFEHMKKTLTFCGLNSDTF